MISEKDIKRINRIKHGLRWSKPLFIFLIFFSLLMSAIKIYFIYEISSIAKLSRAEVFHLMKLGLSLNSLPIDHTFQSYEVVIFGLAGELMVSLSFAIIILPFIWIVGLYTNKFILHLWNHIKEIESKDKEAN